MPTTFRRTVTVIAARHQVPVKSIRLDRTGGLRASAKLGTITYGPELDTQPIGIQMWVAAHELAHVALGHGRRHWAIQGRATAATIPAAVLLIAGIFITAQPVALAASIAGIALLVLAVAYTVRTVRQTEQRQEREADALAASWGYDVTENVADWLTVAEAAHGAPGGRRRRHAAPHDRITAGERDE